MSRQPSRGPPLPLGGTATRVQSLTDAANEREAAEDKSAVFWSNNNVFHVFPIRYYYVVIS